ncbi:unnamed protein product, partial [Pelagomonas calceolata]
RLVQLVARRGRVPHLVQRVVGVRGLRLGVASPCVGGAQRAQRLRGCALGGFPLVVRLLAHRYHQSAHQEDGGQGLERRFVVPWLRLAAVSSHFFLIAAWTSFASNAAPCYFVCFSLQLRRRKG